MSTDLFDPAPDFGQPIAVLKHCHDKIRKQLQTMQKLLTHLSQRGTDPEAQQAATAVLRYFNNAAPHHHADEEEDLLPMLRTTASGEDALLLTRLLPEILREHRKMDTAWQTLEPQLTALAAGTSAALSTEDVRQFVSFYSAHMELEEAHIAPMAKRLFSTAQMAQLGQAMKDRRGI